MFIEHCSNVSQRASRLIYSIAHRVRHIWTHARTHIHKTLANRTYRCSGENLRVLFSVACGFHFDFVWIICSITFVYHRKMVCVCFYFDWHLVMRSIHYLVCYAYLTQFSISFLLWIWTCQKKYCTTIHSASITE